MNDKEWISQKTLVSCCFAVVRVRLTHQADNWLLEALGTSEKVCLCGEKQTVDSVRPHEVFTVTVIYTAQITVQFKVRGCF